MHADGNCWATGHVFSEHRHSPAGWSTPSNELCWTVGTLGWMCGAVYAFRAAAAGNWWPRWRWMIVVAMDSTCAKVFENDFHIAG